MLNKLNCENIIPIPVPFSERFLSVLPAHCVCVPGVCLVPKEVRKSFQIPWNWN